MKFIAGQIIRPRRTTPSGTVIFTNGTDECNPNEQSCVAYGYTWDKYSNTCRAFLPAELMQVMKQTLLIGNSVGGVRNVTDKGSFYNTVNGVANNIKSTVQNAIATGLGNVIEDEKSNTSVSGSHAKVQRQGERALGGGNYQQKEYFCGYAQSSTIHCIGRTNETIGVQALVSGVSGVQGDIDVQTHSNIVFKLTGVAVKEAGGLAYPYEMDIVASISNTGVASICYGTPKPLCNDQVMPKGWTYPQLTQQKGQGGLQLMVFGLAGVPMMHNVKLELLETRNLTDY